VPEHVPAPARIEATGNKPKIIDEFIGRVTTGEERVSIARMRSPGGWIEPAQRPEFTEWTIVLRGRVRVEHDAGVMDVRAGEAVVARPGERVRYSTPDPEGAEYLAVCLPAFTPDTVHREEGDAAAPA